MEIFIAGTKNAIMMVEGGAREVSEADVLEAIVTVTTKSKKSSRSSKNSCKLAGKPKREFTPLPCPR